MSNQIFAFGATEYVASVLKLSKPGEDAIVCRAMGIARALGYKRGAEAVREHVSTQYIFAYRDTNH